MARRIPAATEGFEHGAAAYEAARPSYPAEAVAHIVGHGGIGPGRRVLDLAAGTGKLTRLLVPTGAEVVAVEPVAAMREHLRALPGDVTILDGTAEAIPLPDASVDAVVSTFVLCSVAHPDRSLEEVHRVLRPGAPFVFLEHVGPPPGTPSRRLLDGWSRLEIGHCRPNRDTGGTLERAGFAGLEISESVMRPLGLTVPVIRGRATR